MLNREEPDHEAFEKLCALGAIGELSARELSEMQAHLSACLSCRKEFTDYSEIVHNKLLLARPRSQSVPWFQFFQNRNQRERFFLEAERRGFIFSDATIRSARFWHRLENPLPLRPAPTVALVIFALIGAVAILAYKVRAGASHSAALTAQITETGRRNAALLQQIAEASQVSERQGGAIATPSLERVDIHTSENAKLLIPGQLEAELAKQREENARLITSYSGVEERLQAATVQVEILKAEVRKSENAGNEMTAKLESAERNLNTLNDEIKSLREGRSQDLSVVGSQEARLKEMSEQLRDQAQALDRERRLLAADRDIRELMTARNLHIIDVYDVDGKGKTKKTFGRAFYTEDKSLLFYAFDLEERRITKANYSLQAWGYQQSTERSVHSLGIFYLDDRKQNRWALKFDDPGVLAQIDAVFVTIEPAGGSKRPSGTKLLYAYLKDKPNHP